MKFKRTLTICASLVLSVVLIFSSIRYTNVSAAEYNVNLSIETLQIDINSIPEDRVVHLKMSIENNPGFYLLYFVLQKDSRLSYYRDIPVSPQSFFPGADHCYASDNRDIVNITIPTDDNIFSQNGEFADIRVVLPQTVNVGDFYSVALVSKYNEFETAFFSGNDTSKIYHCDNFTLSNGGISITGQTPAPAEPVVPQPPEAPPAAPPVNNNPVNDPPENNNPPQNNNPPAQTAAPAVATIQNSVTSQSQTTVSASESISDKSSDPSKPAVTAHSSSSTAASESTGIISSQQETENTVSKADSDDKSLKAPAIAAIIIIPAALIASGIFIFFKHKKGK